MRICRWIGSVLFAAILALLASVGCNREDARAKKSPTVTPPTAPVEARKDNTGKTIEARPASRTKPKPPAFKDAVSLDPPIGELIPPDTTVNGKSSGKIFELIANDLWDKIDFTTSDGKSIKYRAVMTTELGDIHIDLYGDSAPNHVRNFVCLAKTGYFNGMTFYFSINTTIDEMPVRYIESGCPTGTGDAGCGSIGYWLKPEINDKLVHEEGVLAAYLNGDPNTAACRFFIAAARMPRLDGFYTIFGKVTQGLDTVHTINKRAVNEVNRPQQPVVIRSVTIHSAVD